MSRQEKILHRYISGRSNLRGYIIIHLFEIVNLFIENYKIIVEILTDVAWEDYSFKVAASSAFNSFLSTEKINKCFARPPKVQKKPFLVKKMFVGIANKTKTLVKATFFFMDWWTNWFFVSVVFADHQTYILLVLLILLIILQSALKYEICFILKKYVAPQFQYSAGSLL